MLVVQACDVTINHGAGKNAAITDIHMNRWPLGHTTDRLERLMESLIDSTVQRKRERTGKLKSSIVPVSHLSDDDIQVMWRLYERYYADVTQERFLKDLNEKQQVILLIDSGSLEIHGFSTVRTIKGTTGKGPYVVVYSGDTIIDKEYWGQTSLQQTFFLLLLKVYATHPGHAVYWFLISKGYKTYLLLAKNFPNYWPRPSIETPVDVKAMMDTIAGDMFGDAWRPDLGVLKFSSKLGCLKAGVAPVDKDEIKDENIRFFVESNPNYFEGDELCCMGHVDRALLAYYPIKLFKKKLGRLVSFWKA